LFVTLGFWQLRRADEKAALFDRFDSGTATTAGIAPADAAEIAGQRYRRVRLTGGYDNAHQMLLDARTRDGRAGYEVLTPLRGEGAAVLVNRGWVPADPDRQKLPALGVASGGRTVTGLLDKLPSAPLSAGRQHITASGSWPRVLLYPTAAEIARSIGYQTRGYQVLLDADAPDGFDRRWRPALLATAQHVGYAVQWFALAIALGVIYVALNLRKATAD
jgi:surfeit locus 1 family protein